MGCPLKIRLQEPSKTVTQGEIEKSAVADHIWRDKGDHRPLWENSRQRISVENMKIYAK